MCRIAMLSVHTCPLATLGGKETGGMNVYVRELSRELGRQGKQVDIFTRAQDPTIAPVRNLAPNVRVIHIPAGPVAPLDKNALVDYLDEFVANVEAFRRAEEIAYDLVHAHYWLSGVAGRQLADQWGVPLVAMFHTLGKLKNQVAKTEGDRDTDRRIALEGDVMQWADRIVAATPLERAQMTWHYGAPTRPDHRHPLRRGRAAVLPAQPARRARSAGAALRALAAVRRAHRAAEGH